jgi:hypothetical protein
MRRAADFSVEDSTQISFNELQLDAMTATTTNFKIATTSLKEFQDCLW